MICPYGNKCSFAHGVEELRSKLLVPTNYKTVRCQQYFEENVCNYGPRCQFLHRDMNSSFVPCVSCDYNSMLDGMLIAFEKETKNVGDTPNLNKLLEKFANVSNYNLKKLRVFQSVRAEQ